MGEVLRMRERAGGEHGGVIFHKYLFDNPLVQRQVQGYYRWRGQEAEDAYFRCLGSK